MSLQDYVNRKYDYLALQNVRPAGNSKLGLELFNSQANGQLCVGIQKLSQRWLLEFFTALGSMPGKPDRGSTFMPDVQSGQLLNALNVATAFEAASIGIRRNLQNEEYDDMPPDERFDSADILSIAILPGYLELSVQLNSRAGSSREIILPVATIPVTS